MQFPFRKFRSIPTPIRKMSIKATVDINEVWFKDKQSADSYLNNPDFEVLRYDINPTDQSITATYREKD